VPIINVFNAISSPLGLLINLSIESQIVVAQPLDIRLVIHYVCDWLARTGQSVALV